MANKYNAKNRKHLLITEVQFNETKTFRVSTLAATFHRSPLTVNAAVDQILADQPDLKVEMVESEGGRGVGRPTRLVGRRVMNRLLKTLNVTRLWFAREKNAEKAEKPVKAKVQKERKARTPRAESAPVTEGRVTEAQFAEMFYFRLKIVAGAFNKSVVSVGNALRELRETNPNLDVRVVETGTKGRPPVEVSRDVLNQLGDKLKIQQLYFAPEPTQAETSTDVVVYQPGV